MNEGPFNPGDKITIQAEVIGYSSTVYEHGWQDGEFYQKEIPFTAVRINGAWHTIANEHLVAAARKKRVKP